MNEVHICSLYVPKFIHSCTFFFTHGHKKKSKKVRLEKREFAETIKELDSTELIENFATLPP